MEKITLFAQKIFKNNQAFNVSDPFLNQDSRIEHMKLLKDEYNSKGFDISTQDINNPKESCFQIHTEIPKTKVKSKNAYLILLESPVVIRRNWDIRRHEEFKKIFTYNTDLLKLNTKNNKKYIKISWPVHLEIPDFISTKEREKDFILVSGNKYSLHPKELFSERKNIIDFFEIKFPNRLDLFGSGWDSNPKSVEYLSLASRLKNKAKSFFLRKDIESPSLYRGLLNNKKKTYQNYKFCFILENMIDLNGYITEKIWECLSFGIIPIYLGASDIESNIPSNCFINLRDFNSDYEKLISWIDRMDHQKKDSYLIYAQEFMRSVSENFTYQNFISPVVHNTISETISN